MRKFLFAILPVVALGTVYAAAPFHTAWEIREAVRAGDVATLEQKVDWASVRDSLKRTAGETRAAIAEMTQEAAPVRPSLWQRLKTAAAPWVAEPLIDRYVTAGGAPQLYAWRQTWRQKVRPTIGLEEPAGLLAGTVLGGTWVDTVASTGRRIERAAFATPTRVEIVLRDRYQPARRWQTVLELKEYRWRLTEVHIVRTVPSGGAGGAAS